VDLWDVATGTLKTILTGHTGVVRSVSFSPDGTTLASGSWDATVRLWDVAMGTLKDILTGYPGPVNSVSFSPDGTTLASGSHDGTVLLWDLTPETAEPETFLREDVNQDGKVNLADLVTVARSLKQPLSDNPRADVNADGAISLTDLVIVARYIFVIEQAAGAPTVDGVVLDAATVQTWIRLAELEDDGTLAFQEGMANLKKIFAALMPQETALLANYPNPFNPETWIPYQLAKPAEVSVSIYTADGKLVRTLALGHHPAGVYQDKSRAAYWDGKNAQGEPVASGVYFYTLTAGDFSATRKMLIRK